MVYDSCLDVFIASAFPMNGEGSTMHGLMVKFRRNGVALLAAALVGFTRSSVGLVEVELMTKKMIIRWSFPEQ